MSTDPERRHEAGTPNVLGVVAIAAACEALTGWSALIAEEERLLSRLRTGLAAIPGVRELSLWGQRSPRVGIVSFVVKGRDSRAVATALSDRYGIGVRDGKFCAHPLVRRLLDEGPGAAPARRCGPASASAPPRSTSTGCWPHSGSWRPDADPSSRRMTGASQLISRGRDQAPRLTRHTLQHRRFHPGTVDASAIELPGGGDIDRHVGAREPT
jgi:hypothetical protein